MNSILFLVGPTATGKSKIAIALAKQLHGEIISADSMLIYKKMDIGTAKPSKAEQKNVPHHLIDILEPSKKFSVFQYRKLALKKIHEIIKRKKLPIVVGGSGLYVRALLKGIEPELPSNPKLRRKLSQEAQKKNGLQILYDRLKRLNPDRADKIKPTDERRIVRALEIAAIPKKKINALPPKTESLKDLGFAPCVIGITKDRALLYQEIEKRVDQMFRRGLVREVKKVLKGKPSVTALQAVGYKEVIGALRKEYSMDRARELVKTNSRHLAKRQWTWFKREEGIQWVELHSPEDFQSQVARILQTVWAEEPSSI